MSEKSELSPATELNTSDEHLCTRRAEQVLLVALVILFIWKGLMPAWSSLNTDFPTYYLAARLYRQGYPVRKLNDWIWIARQKDHASIDRPVVEFSTPTLLSILRWSLL